MVYETNKITACHFCNTSSYNFYSTEGETMREKKEDKQAISITLDKQVLDKARKEAEQKERSISYVINEHLKDSYKSK